MGRLITPRNWLLEIEPGSRVLLINPPVYDSRYAWIRWNQPLDLLKLGAFLRTNLGCQVEILDFMLPGESGRVYFTDRKPPTRRVGGTDYKVRVYGSTLGSTMTRLDELNASWPPDYVVLSTLTSYWGESLHQLVPRLKTQVPQASVTITGSYAVFESEHAASTHADYVVTDFLSLSGVVPAYDLYFTDRAKRLHEGKTLRFAGLSFPPEVDPTYVLQQMDAALQNGIKTFVFFTDDLFAEEGKPLCQVLQQVQMRGWTPSFHGLCGIFPSRASSSTIWQEMLKGGFREVHLEYDVLEDGEINVEAYRRARRVLYNHLDSHAFTGFLMIGTPEDDIHRIIRQAFNLLELTRSVIPKPYTPSPGTEEYRLARQSIRLEYLSPHLFPAINEERLSRKEYEEVYRLLAFLTDKRLGRSFDFFDTSAVSEAFRSSLRKGVKALAE